MNKQTCPICKKEIDLDDNDKIKVCYGIDHLTLNQWKEKERRKNENTL